MRASTLFSGVSGTSRRLSETRSGSSSSRSPASANVRRWADDIVPLLTDDDPLGVDTFASHWIPLEDGPHGYEIFQQKNDGACKAVLSP